MRFKRITKENGSIYNSTRERVDSRNLMEMEAPSDGLLPWDNIIQRVRVSNSFQERSYFFVSPKTLM